MFGGGIADKLGNLYEAHWAVRQLLDVLQGRRASMRVEGLGDGFAGFEFVVDDGKGKVWHQTKINAPGQNWTTRALQSEGVLAAISSRVAAGDRCVFVSQSPAVDLSDLSSKARYAENFSDFDFALADTPRAKFNDFLKIAGLDASTAFNLLKNCEFRTVPQDEIKAAIENLAALLFENDPETVFPAARAFIEKRLNRDLTTDLVRDEIEADAGLRLKDWTLAQTLRGKLASQNEDYLASYIPFGAAGHVVKRSLATELLACLEDPAGPGVVLVGGVAGAGKSGIARDLVTGLAEREITHLIFRVDHHLDCKSPTDFGRSVLEIQQSPVTVLKGLAQDRLSVLVIDQLDAVSEISGRNGVTRNAVLRMVEEARIYSTVRVVIICRSFDLENDERIKYLRQRDDFRQFDVQLLDWKEEVVPVLDGLGVPAERLDAAQRELLRLPLNLAVFAEVSGEKETEFSSRNDLFEKLLTKKQRAIISNYSQPPWALATPLRALCEWMSSRQKLDAPVSVLDDHAQSLDILTSEHLISRSRDTVSFFHESFFDYMFARSFAGKSQTLLDLLTSSEQHLFRRTQVRQILESLRQTDFPRYLDELTTILTADGIRFHIKLAVAKWLAALSSPTSEERDLVLSLDVPGSAFPILVRDAVIGTAGWFDVLIERQWLARQLNSDVEPRKRAVLWFIEKVAAERPAGVAELLDRWWNGDDARGCELLSWFSYMRDQRAAPQLVALCQRVIASRPSNLFAGERMRQELLIARWASNESVEDAASILKTYFNWWFDAHPGEHPFERDLFEQMDIHSLGELGKRSPKALLEGTIDALVSSLALIKAKCDGGQPDYAFYFRQKDSNGIGADRLIHLMRVAFQTIARKDPGSARNLLNKIDPQLHEVAIHLHLETIAANPENLADLLIPLITMPDVLEAGWDGARWQSFADAASAALPYLDKDAASRVESFILRLWPEIELASQAAADAARAKDPKKDRLHAAYYLSKSGHKQFCILRTIGEQRLGSAAIKRLAELGRKFDAEDVDQPTSVRMQSVDSPISLQRAKYMSDDNWIDAINRHDRQRRTREQDRYVGGARELSAILKTIVTSDPARFIALLGKLPAEVDDLYVRAILEGVLDSEAAAIDERRTALLAAHGFKGRPFGDAICRSIVNNPELCADDECWATLKWYAENGRAPESDKLSDTFGSTELVTIENLLDRGGQIMIRGINSVRGWALEAVTQVLWHVPSRLTDAQKLVERRIKNEKDLSVRCCLVSPLIPLFNVDKFKCAESLETIAGAGQGPTSGIVALLTRPAVHLMPYIIHQVPAAGRRLVERMAQSDDEKIRLVGAWQVLRSSFHEQSYVEWADQLLARNDRNVRLLSASIAANAIEEATFQGRATDQLRSFFADEDKNVRKNAAEVFRYLPRDRIDLVDQLAMPFIKSDSFREETFALLHFLEEAQIKIVDLVVATAERIIECVASEGAAQHDISLHQLNEIMNREYVNSERDPEVRKRLLDVVDRMLTMDVRGVDELFKKHER